jgi:hypothetical protein
MKLREDRPVSWLARAAVAAVLLGGGVLAAFPFRRESPPPITPISRHTSDSVRLVFRNQDITLKPNPLKEESPARLPPAKLETPQDHRTGRLPDFPPQYQALLDPNSTTPQTTAPTTTGRVMEPALVPAPPKFREHVLVDGDSLERLAKRYLGDIKRAEEIRALNADVLTDADTLPIGKVLRIPLRK